MRIACVGKVRPATVTLPQARWKERVYALSGASAGDGGGPGLPNPAVRDSAAVRAHASQRAGAGHDLLEPTDLCRSSTGQPQRRSRHAWELRVRAGGFVISLLSFIGGMPAAAWGTFEAGRYPKPFHTT
jgi:hypothetical protein